MRNKNIKKANLVLSLLLLFFFVGIGIIFCYGKIKDREFDSRESFFDRSKLKTTLFAKIDYPDLLKKIFSLDLSTDLVGEMISLDISKDYSSDSPGQKEEEKQEDKEQVLVEERGEGEDSNLADNSQEEIVDEPLEDFSFAVVADSASSGKASGFEDNLTGIINYAARKKPDLLFLTGDGVNLEGKSEQEVFASMSMLKNELVKADAGYYIIFGEKDLTCAGSRKECLQLWQENFFSLKRENNPNPKATYSFDFANTHFVLLSSNFPQDKGFDDQQLEWLENDLNASKKRHKVVFSHISPVSFFEESQKKCFDFSCDSESAENLLRILKDAQVDLVVSGHEEVFDHKQQGGIDFVLAGNSGQNLRHDGSFRGDIFSFFTVREGEIILEAIRTDKERVLRKISIKQ